MCRRRFFSPPPHANLTGPGQSGRRLREITGDGVKSLTSALKMAPPPRFLGTLMEPPPPYAKLLGRNSDQLKEGTVGIPRLEAIHIGTNFIRCILIETAQSGSFPILGDEKVTVRLGDGLFASGCRLKLSGGDLTNS